MDKSLELRIIRRKFHENDEIFLDANLERALKYKSFLKYDFILDSTANISENCICPMKGCSQKLRSYKEVRFCFLNYLPFVILITKLQIDSHFKEYHFNQCNNCYRNFATNRLLEIHISETHDTYFQAVSLRKPSYVCLREDCKCAFNSDKERRLHLISEHFFPKSFDFHKPKTYRYLARKKCIAEFKLKNNGEDISGNVNPNKSKYTENSMVNGELHQSYPARKKFCIFFSQGRKCKYGNECRFIHDIDAYNNLGKASAQPISSPSKREDEDMDVDDLATSLCRMKVGPVGPVSFGRCGRKGRIEKLISGA